jgi:HemY protein
MIRLLGLVAVLFAAAAGFTWLAERPGGIVLLWQGYEIRTSLMVAAIAIALLIGAIAFVGALVRWIVSTPQSLGHFIGARRRDRGYRALTRGMIAVGAGDVRAAQRAAHESQSLLGREPLVLLLSAQAAQIAGDGAAARSAFEALSAEHDTRLLGLHGLFVEARRQGEHAAARHFAEEAVRLRPKINWAGTALFEYQSRAGDWQAALATLSANTDAKLIDREKARRYRAVLDTARAMELEAGEPDEARALALEAHKLAPDLTPAAVTAARLFARAGEIRRATRILEATWKLAPHPEIAAAYADVRPGDSVRDRLQRIEHLATLRANNAEGALAIARAAIDAREWQKARTALGGMMRANPTERVCLLMAEIEAGEHNDQGRVRLWLTRALSAPGDPVWTADGEAFDHWAPVSPVSGRLDAFEWRVVSDRTPARPAFELEGGEAPGESEPQGMALAAPRPALSSEPREPETGAGQTATLRAITPEFLPPVSSSAPRGAARPMARAPDDPGPQANDESETADFPPFHPGRAP